MRRKRPLENYGGTADVNHLRDPGGATNRGVTQHALDAGRRLQGLLSQDVRNITRDEADRIFVAEYFHPVRFSDLQDGLDYAMADHAFNSGPGRAVRELQRIVGTAADGLMGAKTLDAVIQRDAADLVIALCEIQMAFLRRLPTWDAFGRGWTSRAMGRRDGVQDDDIGVTDRGVMLASRADSIPAPVVQAPPRRIPLTCPVSPSRAGRALAGLHPAVQAVPCGG